MSSGFSSLSKSTIAVVSFVCGAVTFMCIFHIFYPKDTPQNIRGVSSLDVIPSEDCDQKLKSVHNGYSFINCRNRKQSLITSIFTRDATTWNRNEQICNQCFDFPKANLKTPKGLTPIFVYNVKKDIWVSTSLLRSGGFETNKFNILFKMLKDDPELNVIDIGANIGVLTLSVAKMGRLVMGVEALNTNMQHVCASVMEGSLQDKVVLVYNAISNERTVVNLGVDKNNMGGTFVDVDSRHIKDLKGKRVQGHETYGQVQTITMDDLLDIPEMKYFPKVVIKMDIEGFEGRALEKGHEFFKQIMVVGVLMEWVFHANQQSGKDIIKFFTDIGYSPYSPSKTPLSIQKSGQWGTDVLWLPNSSKGKRK